MIKSHFRHSSFGAWTKSRQQIKIFFQKMSNVSIVLICQLIVAIAIICQLITPIAMLWLFVLQSRSVKVNIGYY